MSSDSGADCNEGEGVLSHNCSSQTVLCDELSSIVIDGQSPNRSRSQKPDSSRRQRYNSLCSPNRKPDKRRRSRSLQLDKSDDLQREKNPPQKKFVSMAEAMYKFQRSTPERFHTRPVIDGSQRCQTNQGNPAYKKLRCTVPQSPHFTSHLRVRPITYPSKEEREEAELQEMQKYVFKAAPLKTDILKEPQLLKKVEPKPVTKPTPFQLTEVKKLTGAEKLTDPSKTVHTNRNIFPAEKQPVGLDEHSTVPPVWQKKVPEVIPVTDKEIEQKGVKKATPIKRVTVPAPFTFVEKDKIRQQQKEEKIRQVLEEEKRAREFRANPIPKSVKFSHSQLEIKSLSPTQPEPFHLYTEERRLQHEEALKAKLEEERRAMEVVRFKARPPVVLMKKPFEPVKPHRVLKEITDICLNTEIRSKERERFEMKMKEKEMLLEEFGRQLREQQERQEEEERARLRREAVHKAQPIPKFVPMVLAKSTKELTVPESPFSRTKKTNK